MAARASTSRACSSQPATWVESSCQAAPRRASSAVARSARARRWAAAASDARRRRGARARRGRVGGVATRRGRLGRRGQRRRASRAAWRGVEQASRRGGARRRARAPRCVSASACSLSAVGLLGRALRPGLVEHVGGAADGAVVGQALRVADRERLAQQRGDLGRAAGVGLGRVLVGALGDAQRGEGLARSPRRRARAGRPGGAAARCRRCSPGRPRAAGRSRRGRACGRFSAAATSAACSSSGSSRATSAVARLRDRLALVVVGQPGGGERRRRARRCRPARAPASAPRTARTACRTSSPARRRTGTGGSSAGRGPSRARRAPAAGVGAAARVVVRRAVRPLLRERDVAVALQHQLGGDPRRRRRGAGTARSPSTPSGASPSASGARSSAARALRRTTTCRCRCGRRRRSGPGCGSSVSVAGAPIPRKPSTVTERSHTGGAAAVARRLARRARDLDHALGLGVEVGVAQALQQQGAQDGIHLEQAGDPAFGGGDRAAEGRAQRGDVAACVRACSRTNSHCGISSAAANALASSSMSRAGRPRRLVDRRAAAEQRLLAAAVHDPVAELVPDREAPPRRPLPRLGRVDPDLPAGGQQQAGERLARRAAAAPRAQPPMSSTSRTSSPNALSAMSSTGTGSRSPSQT